MFNLYKNSYKIKNIGSEISLELKPYSAFLLTSGKPCNNYEVESPTPISHPEFGEQNKKTRFLLHKDPIHLLNY